MKTILFDMGGVVTLQDADEARRRFVALGVDAERYLHKHGHRGIFGQLENGDIEDAEFVEALGRIVGRGLTYDEVQHCWLGFKREAPIERLHCIEALRERYRVCLASNCNPFIIAAHRTAAFCTERRPITDYFDALYLSYEMHVSKPSAKFFERILAAEGVRADECLFVDDSLPNTQVAAALGIHSLHVATNDDWRAPVLEFLEHRLARICKD